MIARVSIDDDQPGADLLDRWPSRARRAIPPSRRIGNPVTEAWAPRSRPCFSTASASACATWEIPRLPAARRWLTQITRDDTYVQSLVDGSLTGGVGASAAVADPQGPDRPPGGTDAEVRRSQGRPVPACSDGLSDPVSRETIAEALAEGTRRSPIGCLELALRSGGPDNITIIIADVVDASVDTPISRRWPAPWAHRFDAPPSPSAGRADAAPAEQGGR